MLITGLKRKFILSCGLGVEVLLALTIMHWFIHCIYFYLFVLDDHQVLQTMKSFVVLPVQQNKDPLITKQV